MGLDWSPCTKPRSPCLCSACPGCDKHAVYGDSRNDGGSGAEVTLAAAAEPSEYQAHCDVLAVSAARRTGTPSNLSSSDGLHRSR